MGRGRGCTVSKCDVGCPDTPTGTHRLCLGLLRVVPRLAAAVGLLRLLRWVVALWSGVMRCGVKAVESVSVGGVVTGERTQPPLPALLQLYDRLSPARGCSAYMLDRSGRQLPRHWSSSRMAALSVLPMLSSCFPADVTCQTRPASPYSVTLDQRSRLPPIFIRPRLFSSLS